jgi:crotonobetainyl-CoA:carnitine CoA-transferase CaiB-like acyl-CoA transferase
MGPIFLNTNRNKRSLVLDLKQPAGLRGAEAPAGRRRRADLQRAAAGDGAPGPGPRDAVSALNPRLVYAGLFGFGQDGPYAARPAYDDLIQGGGDCCRT